ncbi:hypothetical protein [Pinirhizobacter sp.]|jgi:hypothetical protein|uniref:hypothetical protein n=1 Tax=Pinirhizobacter sp. TaxID=2950432 RepID=UPI002F426575
MQKVEIYRFRKYDINSDTWVESRRYGTHLAIVELGGKPMGNTLIAVDASMVGQTVSLRPASTRTRRLVSRAALRAI